MWWPLSPAWPLRSLCCQCARHLQRIGALLQTNNLLVPQCPYMGKLGRERLAGRSRPPDVVAQGEHTILQHEKLRGDRRKLVKVAGEPTEEVTDAVEPDVDAAVRKALGNLPP